MPPRFVIVTTFTERDRVFLFLKAVTAHLVADFVLQFEELYQLKLRHAAGHVLHVLFHALVLAALVFPYLDLPAVWVYIAGTSAFHLGQDLVKYKLQKKRPRLNFLIFVTDQLVHLAVLSSVLIIPQAWEPRPWPALDPYYADSRWTILAIALLLSTFAGSYLLHAFWKNYGRLSRPDEGIRTPEMIHALIERSTITLVCLTAPHILWIAALPAVGLLRLARPELRKWKYFLSSFLYAAWIGFLFRAWW
jgi:hypothetical protein